MALVFVTGLPGTGKSAVLTRLRARGHQAHGVDEDGYADWISRSDGTIADFPHEDPDFDFHAWYREHNWVLSAQRITRLRQAATGPVFLCGVADGEDKVWHLFDAVIALVADLPTLRRRIEVRGNQFGKTPEEFDLIARHHRCYEDTYRGFGAVIVDATRRLDQVVDEILAVGN